MALPKGMFRRSGQLWARKDVPTPLRKLIGQTSLQTSLRTDSLEKRAKVSQRAEWEEDELNKLFSSPVRSKR